jgi:hypothetical protein
MLHSYFARLFTTHRYLPEGVAWRDVASAGMDPADRTKAQVLTYRRSLDRTPRTTPRPGRPHKRRR